MRHKAVGFQVHPGDACWDIRTSGFTVAWLIEKNTSSSSFLFLNLAGIY